MHRAGILANSGMVRKAYEGKPEAIMYAGAKGAELGWSLVASLDFIDPIEGRAEVNAQGRLALIRQAGHEAEVVDDQCDDTKAVVRGRRRGSQEWHYVTWTIEEAEKAGLRAEWVKKWVDGAPGRKGHYERVALRREGNGYVPAKFGQTELPDWAQKAIAAGKVECNDSWWNYPGDKLVARAASRLCRRHFSEVLIGRGLSLHTAEEQGYSTDSDLDETAVVSVTPDLDDEVVEAEVVEEDAGAEIAVAPPGPVGDAEQTAAVADRENGGGEATVVGSPPPAPGPVDWREVAKQHGVTPASILVRARQIASAKGWAQPGAIEDVTDEQLVAAVLEGLAA